MEEYDFSSPNMQPSNISREAYVILTSYPLKCIYVTIGALGLIGNIFVILVIFSSKVMRIHRTNVYIVNQSFIDATVAMFLILTTLLENDGRDFDAGRTMDVLYCKLWLNKVWLWSFLVSSTYNIMVLTLERYMAIVHPFWHKVKLTRRKIVISLICVWLIGPVYNLMYMVPSTGIIENGNCTVYSLWPTENTQITVGMVTIAFQFIFPLFFLIVCYSLIAINLHQRLSPISSNKDDSESNLSTATNTETIIYKNISSALRNIIRTVFIVSACFVACWIPNQVYYFMFHLRSMIAMDFTSTFYHFTVVAVFCTCCINPFVYIAQYKAFQRATTNLMCGTKKKLWSNNSSETPA